MNDPLFSIRGAPLPAPSPTPAPQGDPLMSIRGAPLERRGFDMGTTLREGVQDIGRIGLALPALGEQIVSLFADVPEGSAPASETLRDMAQAEAARREFEAAGKAQASLVTQVGEGAARSAVGAVPGIALAPLAVVGKAAPLAVNAVAATPGTLSTAGNQLGVDLNNPEMGPARRIGRAALQGGLEMGGEMLPMGRVGLGPEAALARVMAGSGAPPSLARAGGDVVAQMFQEAITGGAQSVANDVTGTAPVTAGEVVGNAGEAAGMGALTALPVAAGMGGAAQGLGAIQSQQAAAQQRRADGARQVAAAFDPANAQVQVTSGEGPAMGQPVGVPQPEGPGPVSITPDVIDATRANPGLLDVLKPAQVAEAVDQDQQAVADAVEPGAEDAATALGAELSLADEQVRAKQGLERQEAEARRRHELAGIADEALGEKSHEPPPEAPDLAAEAAKKTLADQERVQTENRERERRRRAFAVREDLRIAESDDFEGGGAHFYDERGRLTLNPKAKNPFYLPLHDLQPKDGLEAARAFVRDTLGDDMGAFAADDPTATPAAAKFRMEAKPLPPQVAAGVRTSTPVSAPTAAELVAMPHAARMEAFRALSPEARTAIQPEVGRLMQEQRKAEADQGMIHGFNDDAPAEGPVPPPAKAPRAAQPPATVPAAVPAASPAPAATETGIPVSTTTAPEAPKPASAAVPEPNAAPKAPPAPVANPKELGRLARISKAVLPDTVQVTEHGDHVRITYPGGASIQVRPVESLPLDAAAWFDSVAKVKGAMSAAFSRAGYGPLMPPKAAFLRMPKAQREKVMAELQPVAAVTDISGRRVGVSREALVRLATPGKRTDAQVADALEEEDHHFLFSGLLTTEERTIVRDELTRSRPELAKEDPASRAVMEAAYEHWRTWNQDRQKAAITPRTAGIFRRLAERIRTMLRWFDKTPAVSAKTAAQVWEGLGEARGRAEVTPAAQVAEEGENNATLIPRDQNLGGAELRRQWQKATGEKPAKTDSFQELAKKADAVDKAKGRQVAYSVPQALNEVMPSDQRQTFDQWQEEASAILADPEKLADVRARAQADAGLSPAEQITLRRLVSDQLAEAAQSGNANRWQEALETAALRKAAGSRVARELASRRLDLSTPEGRREAILSYTAEMGSRWQNAYNKATTKRDRAAVVAKWQAQQEKIQTVLKKRFGIDLSDPRVGEIFSDAYSLGRLFDAVADAGGSRFSLGNLVGYYTAGNLLTAASFAVNLTGYPMMGAIAGLKGATQITAKHLMGMKGNRELTSMQGAWAGARAGTAAIGRGLTNGALAFWTGRPQAEKQAKPISDDANDHTRSTSPIKNPFARAATAPFLEANRFVDEMFWTVAYNGALAAGATEARMAGDKRSHREMIDSPDADLVERATEFADWMTLRTGNKSRLERGIAAVRSPTALEDIVDSAVPGLGRFAVNPLYFTMPFFSAIARLTAVGAQISPYGMIANVALGAKRAVDATRADNQADKDKLNGKAINNLAYALGGLALLGLSLVGSGGDDDKDLVTGSPKNYKSAGERAVREAVEKPRTIGGHDYSRFDPVALPLSLHADMRDAMREVAAGDADWKTLRTLGEKAFNATIERQFLSGISDLFKPQYDENGDPKGVLTKFGENVTGMLAPGRPWISTARKLTETEKMERPRGDIERVYEDGSPSRNVFGERETLREDTTGAAVASLFVSPKVQASPEGQKWQKRILELNEAIEEAGGKPWFPANPGRAYTQGGKTVKWSEQQFDRVRELAGTKWLAMLRGAKALDNAELAPETQLKIIKALKDQANEYASGMVRAGR